MWDMEKSEDWVLNHVSSLDHDMFDQDTSDYDLEGFNDEDAETDVSSDYLMLFTE